MLSGATMRRSRALQTLSFVWRFLRFNIERTATARTKFLIKLHFLVKSSHQQVYIIIIDSVVKKKVSKNAQFIEKFLTLNINININRQAN